jgi:hypothetical protein
MTLIGTVVFMYLRHRRNVYTQLDSQHQGPKVAINSMLSTFDSGGKHTIKKQSLDPM